MKVSEFKRRIFSLSERLYPMVVRMLGRESIAKDAIQEIMIKLWQQREKLEGHPNTNGYVFLTARNYCLDQIKKNKPTYVSEDHLPTQERTKESTTLEYHELIDTIQLILQKCTIKHHEVIILRDIDGLEFEEIAAITQLKVEHIRVALSRTRKYVQKELVTKHHYDYGQKK